jgi:protein-disulfide isomerase
MALGKDLDVNSTPTLFINGRRVPAVPYETLQKLINFAAKDNTEAKK